MPINSKNIRLEKFHMKNTNKTVTIIAICILFFSSAISASAEAFFSGYSGAAITANPTETLQKPQLTGQAFFAGQFDLSGIFVFRTELSVQTDNIFSHGLFQDTPASFSIDEISVTTRFKTRTASHFFAIFLGEYESIGSDLFLQRQFGIRPFGSKIMETWLGLNGTAIYPFSGAGLTYTVRFQYPTALGAYFYVNEKDSLINLNTDIRFAGIFNNAVFDIAIGASFPIETKDSSGKNVFLLIRTMDIHSGFSLLLGNRYSTSLFLQGGIHKLRVNPKQNEHVLKLSDLYFIIEPRFVGKRLQFHFSLFNIPQDMAEDLFYIQNPMGCNLTVFSDNLQIGMFNTTIGSHFTLSAQDKTLSDINTIRTENLAFQIAPFLSTRIFGGTLNTSIKLDVLDLKEWRDSFKFTLGYKVQL